MRETKLKKEQNKFLPSIPAKNPSVSSFLGLLAEKILLREKRMAFPNQSLWWLFVCEVCLTGSCVRTLGSQLVGLLEGDRNFRRQSFIGGIVTGVGLEVLDSSLLLLIHSLLPFLV